MASQISQDSPKIGSILPAEVEQALPNLLIVALKSGGKVFRGVLIDTQSGSCPVGVPDTLNLGSRLNKEFGVPVVDTALVLHEDDPGTGDTATQVENSALSFRQSYFQNMPLPPPRPLLFGKKEKTPEIKQKTMSHSRSRPFKLRPRQLLCTKCKGACQPGKAKTAQTGRQDRNGLKKRKLDSSNDGGVRKKSKHDSRTVLNGGTNVSKSSSSTGVSRPASTPSKSENNSLKKTSPAIKISYATPGKGQRLIVRIPPRTNNFKQSSASPGLGSKNKKRVLSVPLTPLTAIGKHNNIDSLKRPLLNGLHTSPVKSQHDKIRIVKTKGTYSIPSDNIPVRTYKPMPASNKLVNGNGKLLANVSVKAISLVNGYRPLSMNPKREGPLPSHSFLPHIDCSDTASECSSYTSSSRGSRVKKQNGSINNNNSEYEFDSDASSKDAPKKLEEAQPSMHKKNVTKSVLPGGRSVCVGDIIWGKITGFPWWPGRIVQIIVTRNPEGSIAKQEAQITWFASRSISFMPLTKLPPFLGDFKKYYDKKRKGLYKDAIAQAHKASEALSSEVRELHTMFETPLLNKS